MPANGLSSTELPRATAQSRVKSSLMKAALHADSRSGCDSEFACVMMIEVGRSWMTRTGIPRGSRRTDRKNDHSIRYTRCRKAHQERDS